MEPLGAERIKFQSGTNRAALVELYTSEGCSSCPPAEEWLSQLKADPRLWMDFVPVAFHVDYWDYLGWRDPFGAGSFSERQRTYAAEWREQSVYTPGFVLDGKEWRGWMPRDGVPRASNHAVGSLSATSDDARAWSLRFEPAKQALGERCIFHVALLGFDLTSDVKSGENRGRKLRHDFVVLTTARMEANQSHNVFDAVVSLPKSPHIQVARSGIACWVTRSAGLEPLQAVGGWLPTFNR